MLNEKREVEEILKGNRFEQESLHRTLMLLARHYLSTGHDILGTREKIFAWGQQHEVFVTQNLTRLIAIVAHKLSSKEQKLQGEVEVYITPQDIQNIKIRFDRYNEQLIAFALLCYAKLHSNKRNEFKLSMIGFSNWVGISKNNIYARYLNKNLSLTQYIKKIYSGNERAEIVETREGYKIISKRSIFKINVDCANVYSKDAKVFRDVNLRKEFEEIMGNNKA